MGTRSSTSGSPTHRGTIHRPDEKLDIQIGADLLAGVDPTDRDTLKRRLFGTDGVADARTALLVRYAYQTTDVPSFEPYFVAAEKGPLVRALARSLKTPDAMATWIESNIADGVVLDDDRIQMPDQVLVYREGTTLERALLARTLSVLAGIDPVWVEDAYPGSRLMAR